MQDSTDDKMSCFAIALDGVTPGIYIRVKREEKRGREEREGSREQFSSPGANSPVHCMNNTTTNQQGDKGDNILVKCTRFRIGNLLVIR